MTHYVYFVDQPLYRAYQYEGNWWLEKREHWMSSDWKYFCACRPTLDELEQAVVTGEFRIPPKHETS
jgi:hypothetical protein